MTAECRTYGEGGVLEVREVALDAGRAAGDSTAASAGTSVAGPCLTMGTFAAMLVCGCTSMANPDFWQGQRMVQQPQPQGSGWAHWASDAAAHAAATAEGGKPVA